MPRPSTWIDRVPLIIEALVTSTAEKLTREEVEQLFQVSESRAKTIIGDAGGRRGKHGLTIARVKLLDYVKFSPEAREYQAGVERRKELAAKLENARREQALRKVEIPAASREEWPVLRDVLPKLIFTPGAVTIAHNGTEDFLHTMWLLVQSLGSPSDLEKFREMVDTKQGNLNTLVGGR